MEIKTPTALAGAAVAAAALAAAGAASPKAQLALVNVSPVTVRAEAFHARERVHVVLRRSSGGARALDVTASRGGSFRAAFGTVRLGRCAGFSIRASGSAGSRAVLRRPPLPGCYPG